MIAGCGVVRRAGSTVGMSTRVVYPGSGRKDPLQKSIQCFNSVHLKIPKVLDEAIISAFSNGVRDVKMKEELAIHEELCTSQELFNLATKCTRDDEGRLSLLELPATGAEEKKAKGKDVKRKEVAVLAAEPDTKRGRDQPESSKNSRPFYAFHNLNTHNTSDSQELRAMSRTQSHSRRTLRSTPRAQRPGLRPRRRAWRRTLGRPWPAPGVARPAS